MSAPPLANPNLSLVKLKHVVNKHKSSNVLVNEIVQHIQSIPECSKVMRDIEFIKYVCNLCENNSYSGSQPLDKQAIVLQAITTAFPEMNNDTDIALIKGAIVFLCNNNMIKQIATSTKIGSTVYNWVLKKFA